MMGYATIFTSMPVFSLVVDREVDRESVMKFPPLYKSLQKGRSLNLKTFMIWVWISIFQGSAIMLLSITWFNDSFVNIVSITFTSLIFIELLNVFSQVHHLQVKIIVASICTLVIYLSCILFLRNYFDTALFTSQFLLKVLIVTTICWLPVHFAKRIIEICQPSEVDKIKDK
jgi:phospholipid-translocating ATPase